MYIHLYPAKDNCPDILRTSRIPYLTYSDLFKYIVPLARNWNVNIDHIRWNDRLNPMNHHPFFPYAATTIWDTTCYRVIIYFIFFYQNLPLMFHLVNQVQKPHDWAYGRHVVNGILFSRLSYLRKHHNITN